MGGGGAGDENRVPVYEVTGTVTLGEAPIANAVVTFSPQAEQPVALGRTDSSGNFTLTTYDAGDGAAAGDYVVLVTKTGGGAASPTSDASAMHQSMSSGQPASQHAGGRGGAAGTAGTSALPERYSRKEQSDLRATVQAEGENRFDLKLQP